MPGIHKKGLIDALHSGRHDEQAVLRDEVPCPVHRACGRILERKHAEIRTARFNGGANVFPTRKKLRMHIVEHGARGCMRPRSRHALNGRMRRGRKLFAFHGAVCKALSLGFFQNDMLPHAGKRHDDAVQRGDIRAEALGRQMRHLGDLGSLPRRVEHRTA